MTSAIVNDSDNDNDNDNDDDIDSDSEEASSEDRPLLFDASVLAKKSPKKETSTALVPSPDDKLASPRRNFLARRRGAGPTANSLRLDFGSSEHVVSYEVAEQMRLLMARAKLGHNTGTLAVTSTVAGEGSSFIARSLAAVLAHDSSLSVCLLEIDWEGDHDGENVEAITVQGITEHGDEDTEKEITYISSGYVPPLQRSVFVASEHLADDVEALNKYFDLVVLDLPAVTSHSGVLTLSEFADSFLLVVRQGVASRNQIRAAIRDLGSSRLAGVVMNQVELETPKWLRRLTGS